MEPYIFIAIAAGLFPALFWLWFLLREDSREPEPLAFITLTFLAGMAIVPIALPIQKMVMGYLDGAILVWAWVFIEESLKYLIAAAIVLWHHEVDEPIDTIVYMITIALGFAALENALFIFNPLTNGAIRESIVTGAFRFLGSTLLHVLASGIVGVAMALSFYRSTTQKLLAITLGLSAAVVVHGLFNVIIMNSGGATILGIFFLVWIGIIILFCAFERSKQLYRVYPRNSKNISLQ